MNVDVSSLSHATEKISNWVISRRGGYVCVSNVHMCMEVFDNKGYAEIVNGSDLTLSDGKPISWAQRALGHKNAQQVRGEDITLALCKEAEDKGLSVGFFGATEALLEQITLILAERFPKLDIDYTCAPPFRLVTDEEDEKYVAAINASGVSILFVGLGCPKQEIWMAGHKDRINCVMLGVGAAFDFIAGNKRNAPRWMQRVGLEWLFRLISEPRRLWKRYLKHNPRFVWYFGLQLLKSKISSRKS